MTIPEPPDGFRVVVDPACRLFWRDDAAAAQRQVPDGEHWFRDYGMAPEGWAEVTGGAKAVFLVDAEPWEPLVQPDNPDRVAVRLIVEGVVRDVVFDRAEYEQAKADDKLDHLVDVDVSGMDGESLIVEADGTEIRPF